MRELNFDIAGKAIYWEVDSHSSKSVVLDTLQECGLSRFYPTDPTPLSCLGKAMEDCFPTPAGQREYRHAVRTIRRGRSVVKESPGEKSRVGDDWGEVVATASLDEQNRLTVDPWNMESCVQERMDWHAGWYSQQAIVKMLGDVIIKKFGGLLLRSKGGLYWILAEHAGELDRLSRGLERAARKQGNTEIFKMSVKADADLIRSVGCALAKEVKEETEAMKAEVASGDIKNESMVARRLRTSEAMLRKIKNYEDAFGCPLAELTRLVREAEGAVAAVTIQRAAAAIRQTA